MDELGAHISVEDTFRFFQQDGLVAENKDLNDGSIMLVLCAVL